MMGRLSTALLLGALLVSCSSPPGTSSGAPEPPAGTYIGVGSATTLDQAKLVTAAFSTLHPGVAFQLNVTDTETSIVKVRLADKDADFGFIGRELLPTDGAVATTPIGATGSAFAVNAANPIRSLTKAQLAAILTGQITDWSGVGGTAGPIIVMIRETTSQTRSSLEGYVFGGTKPTYSSGVVTTSAANTASIEMLTALKAFSGAIGMVTLDSATLANPSISLVGMDGIPATRDSLAKGTWPARRSIYLTTNVDPAAVKPAVKALIDFIRSPAGQKVISGP
jgi:phosphate transport system substrate-binding protein